MVQQNFSQPPQPFYLGDVFAASQVKQQTDYNQWLASLSEEFKELAHTLNGEVEVIQIRDGKKIHSWEQQYEPLMNRIGVFRFVSFLRDSLAQKNTFFSATQRDQVLIDCLANADAVKEFLFLNLHRFELKLEDFSYVCELANNLIAFSIRRSVEGKTLDSSTGSVQTRILQQHNINQEQSGGGLRVSGFKLPFT